MLTILADSFMVATRQDGYHPAPRRHPFAGFLTAMIGARRSRQALADLSDAQLRDIGVTREQARIEAVRPVWDVPDTWLRR